MLTILNILPAFPTVNLDPNLLGQGYYLLSGFANLQAEDHSNCENWAYTANEASQCSPS